MKRKTIEDEPSPQREGTPVRFLEWWNPTGTDPISGASVGGHPDAERIWARKDSGRWTRRTYGTTAVRAWLADNYRREYFAWVDIGRPEGEPFVSIDGTLERQVSFWRELRTTLAAIVKPVRRARSRDYDKGKAPHVEPIDEQKAKEESSGPIEF